MKNLISTLFFILVVAQTCLGQWVQIGLDNKSITDIEVRDSEIFAITSGNGTVFYSSNNGLSWEIIINSNAKDISIYQNGKLFLVKDDSLFYSANNGKDWTNTNMLEQINDSLPNGNGSAEKIFISPYGTIYCNIKFPTMFCTNDGIALSNDDGLTWITPNLDMSGRTMAFWNQFVVTTGAANCSDGGGRASYLSSDYGNTWEWLNSNMSIVVMLFLSNGYCIGLEHSNFDKEELCMSKDTCNFWSEIDTLSSVQAGIKVSNGSSEYLLVGTRGLGVYLYSDEGEKIGAINDGLTNLNINALSTDNNGYIYAGTDSGLYRMSISNITSSNDYISIYPQYRLDQNYPNPFNPSTKIKYSVSQTSNVEIKVYDVLGNEIETLVNEEKISGTYELTWNAANLPSGVYFYQLRATPGGGQAGKYTVVKKMLLLK